MKIITKTYHSILNFRNHINDPIYVVGIFVCTLFLFFAFCSYILSTNINCKDTQNIFLIDNGSSIDKITEDLKDRGCIESTLRFKIASYITFNNKSIRAGRYSLKGMNSISDVLNLFTTAKSTRIKVTLVEGWSVKEYARALYKSLDIDTTKFINLCYNYDFMNSLDISAPSLEGYLYPDTYIFLSKYTEKDIIRILVNQCKYIYREIINENNNPNIKYSMHQALTLASIIQGEAIYDDEMPIISSVYHNRLNKNMLLQADPTIQYILPKKRKRLYEKHTKIDNPYNTYLYKNLPPGPINNPGFSAVKSALNPASTKYFYFVADNTGRHIFTTTNKDHVNAKNSVRNK